MNHTLIIEYILYFKTISLKKQVSNGALAAYQQKNIEYTNSPISKIAWLLPNRDELEHVNGRILYVTLITIKLEQSK